MEFCITPHIYYYPLYTKVVTKPTITFMLLLHVTPHHD